MTQQLQLNNQSVTVTSADGVEGILIRTIDGDYYFRVYHRDAPTSSPDDIAFTDYELAHFDLAVTIHDSSAAFYHFPDKQVLDYDPKALGLLE